MRNSVKAGLALGAGILLLAAAEAPIRDLIDDAAASPGIDSFDAGIPGDPAGDATMVAPALMRVEGPQTPLPRFQEAIVDIDTDLEVALPGPPQPEAAPVPRARSLAEAVDQHRGRSDTDLDAQARCLAKAVYWEAKGEPLSGQLAVAQVILNRVDSRRFGSDICSVVVAPRQFSFVRGGHIPDAPHRAQWATAKAVALLALEGDWDDVVGTATHFHATHVNPRWRLQRVAAIGNHIFYR
jgi:hypothetical protein